MTTIHTLYPIAHFQKTLAAVEVAFVWNTLMLRFEKPWQRCHLCSFMLIYAHLCSFMVSLCSHLPSLCSHLPYCPFSESPSSGGSSIYTVYPLDHFRKALAAVSFVCYLCAIWCYLVSLCSHLCSLWCHLVSFALIMCEGKP